jgi:hypothetical protein
MDGVLKNAKLAETLFGESVSAPKPMKTGSRK